MDNDWVAMLFDLHRVMTLEQIGDKLGIGRGHVSKLLNGLVEPKATLFICIDSLHKSQTKAIKKALEAKKCPAKS